MTDEIARLVELSEKAKQVTIVRVPSDSDPSVWEDRYMLEGHAVDAFEKALVEWFCAHQEELKELDK